MFFTIRQPREKLCCSACGSQRVFARGQVAIDEISTGKGHRYLTVVLDLDSGAVLFVGDSKGADALKPFWKRLRCSGAKVEAVAIDMSPADIQAVTDHLPTAAIVFDHFHVIKLFNEKLSDLSRQLDRETTDPRANRAKPAESGLTAVEKLILAASGRNSPALRRQISPYLRMVMSARTNNRRSHVVAKRTPVVEDSGQQVD